MCLRLFVALHVIQVITSFKFVQNLQLDTANARVGPYSLTIIRYQVCGNHTVLHSCAATPGQLVATPAPPHPQDHVRHRGRVYRGVWYAGTFQVPVHDTAIETVRGQVVSVYTCLTRVSYIVTVNTRGRNGHLRPGDGSSILRTSLFVCTSTNRVVGGEAENKT